MLTKADYKAAIVVQDACNLSGVVHSFSEILHRMVEEGLDTKARNEHPISKLFADKIADLARVRGGGADFGSYSEAYLECKKMAEID